MQALLRRTLLPKRPGFLRLKPTINPFIWGRRLFCTTNTTSPYYHLLSSEQKTLLNDEVALLTHLYTVLEGARAEGEDLQALQASIDQLQHLFMLVVVGEFNSGKSSFLNALLGKKFLDDGVTPTTCRIDIIQHSNKPEFENVSPDAIQRKVGLPVDWLKDINLVDTPGTNAIFRFHQTLTEHFVPRSDLVLWVTSVDRAFSESERLFLQQVEQFRKKVLVILSKVDILTNEKDLKEIENFVTTNFKQLTGIEPIIFPVSSRLALEAKLDSKKPLNTNPSWKASGFSELETYIFKTLNATEKSRLKFKNPVGVAEHLLSKYHSDTKARLELLTQDLIILEKIEKELEEFKNELLKHFEYHLDRVDNVLFRLSERGIDFFDTKIALSNIWGLKDHEALKNEFERDVVGKASTEVDEHVSDVVDWLIKKNAKQWSITTDYILARAKSNTDFGGKISPAFDYDRSKILGAIFSVFSKSVGLGDSARRVVNEFDQKKEAEFLSSSIRAGFYQAAVIEVSAGGIALISTSLLDFSGLFPAAIAVAGLGVLPYVRHTLKVRLLFDSVVANMNKQIASLRQRMKETLTVHFQKQLNEGLFAIRENIEPYRRFIVVQEEAVRKSSAELSQTQKKINALKAEINEKFSACE